MLMKLDEEAVQVDQSRESCDRFWAPARRLIRSVCGCHLWRRRGGLSSRVGGASFNISYRY